MTLLHKSKNNSEKYFPLPKFLEVPAVGIDVSDGSVKFIELVKKGDFHAVKTFGEKKIKDGVVINGEIKDKKELVLVLKEIREEFGIECGNVSLPEEKAFLFRATVPAASDESILTNLSFQLEKKVPLALSEAVFDYDLLYAKDKSKSSEAVVTVFPMDFVGSYLGVLKDAGIKPLSLEIEAQAIAGAIVPHQYKGTAMVVDFGHKRTGLSIVSKGAVVYTSTLEVGGSTINDKLIASLNLDEKEIVRIKNEVGFSNPLEKEIYDAMAGTILALKDEVNKHFNYWNSRSEEAGEEKIEKIYLCGGNSNIAGLKEHMGQAFKVVVEKGNVWQNLFSFDEYVPPIDKMRSASFSTAVGLALESIK